MSTLSFTEKLRGEIQRWVNLPIPSDPSALRHHVYTVVSLLSQVTYQHDWVVTDLAALIAIHHAALSQATDTLSSLQADYEAADELLTENRATIRALSSSPATGGGGRPILLSDPAVFNGTKEDLDAFLDRLGNKLRGDANQFNSEIHQISYAVSQLTGDAFEQIRDKYSSYTTVKEVTEALQAAFGDHDPVARPNVS
ncbi:hypothetical protein Q9L58_010201 [Maublancomyces gigas]|uniref:Uncharacterized protein n=1 Tax=Discina gigas TaxID=1032678 RepID=A0ABR3G551_9PEZI